MTPRLRPADKAGEGDDRAGTSSFRVVSGDVAGERRRIDLVVERLNAAFAGRVRIETVWWELS
jgi:hypothetical protein